MKKFLLLFYCTSLAFASAYSQEGFAQVSKNYFRSDPFTGDFSSFIKHLLNDPAIINKKIVHRTDTNLFYFSGVYKDYNPFFFKPRYIEVRLQESPIVYADSLPKDTILVYQLTAYAEASEAGKQDVKKEFEKIHKRIHKKFSESNSLDLKNGKTISGNVHNYFVFYASLAPLSVLWATLDDTGEPVLNIILRLKTSNNQAVLATPLYNP